MPRRKTDPTPPNPEPTTAGEPAIEYDYATGNQRFARIEEFVRFGRGYPQRQALVAYLYRLEPKIDRRQVGLNESCLEKVTSATIGCPDGIPDENYLLERWGSGTYQLSLNDLSWSGWARRAICTVTIEDPEREPILDPGELIISGPKSVPNQPVIARYLARGWTIVEARNDLIDGAFKQLAPPMSARAVQTVPDPVPPPATQAAGTLPAGYVMLDAASAARLLGAPQPAAGPDLPMFKTVFELADRISTRAPAAPADVGGFAQLRESIALLQSLGWNAPGQPAVAAASDSGGSWLENLVMKLPEIFREGRLLLQGLASMPATAAVAQQQQMNPAPEPAAIEPDEDFDEDEEAEQMLVPDLGALMQLGQRAVTAFEQGVTGERFAADLYRESNMRPLVEWLRSMDPSQVIHYLSQAPGLAGQVGPDRSRFEQWVYQFFQFQPPTQ